MKAHLMITSNPSGKALRDVIRRFTLINCDDVTQAEEKLLRNHDSDEKKRVDRVIYYKEMGVAHQQVGDKHYYMIILMR